MNQLQNKTKTYYYQLNHEIEILYINTHEQIITLTSNFTDIIVLLIVCLTNDINLDNPEFFDVKFES